MDQDQTAASNFEITADLAEAAEEILEDFAQDAELDVAVIVEESGALIAGISADDNIDVHTVAALVAGNIGATRALGKVVGETGTVETINQGTDKITYLRELNDRFVLVGIAESILPAGIIREKASQISEELLDLLVESGLAEDTAKIKLESDDDQETEDAEHQDSDEVTNDEDAETDDEESNESFKGIELTSGSLSISEFDDEESEEENPESDDEETITETAAPVVINSPFEIADDDEEEEDDEEIESVFELGEGTEDESETESKEENGDEVSVSAPMLVTPAVPTEEDIARKVEEDATTAVAAISTPIATDIAKNVEEGDEEETGKKTSPESSDENHKDDDDDDNSDSGDEIDDDDEEDDDDGEESVGGPRYVFEIG